MPKLTFAPKLLSRHVDPREVPSYTIAEAAHYLSIPLATVRAWVKGTSYNDSTGRRRQFKRVIELPQRNLPLMSFFNLAEAHVLRALRTNHKIRLQHIRRALDYVRNEFGWGRPLIHEGFRTNGVSLFVERLGQLVDASAKGQVVMPEIMEAHLERLDWRDDLAARLHPFTRKNSDAESPRSILIDPDLSFGRPVIASIGITTSVVAERYKAGDSIAKLVRDYGGPQSHIEEAIRCELQIGAAA